MRHTVFLIAALFVLVLLGASPALIGAQATPAPSSEPIAGVSGGEIGAGEPEAAPGFVLSLRRAVFEPGGYVSLHHHPGALVLYVESGELTYGPITKGETEVARAAVNGTPGPTERIGPGDEVVLKAGDWLFEQGVTHGARNDSDTPTVVWLSALWEGDQPGTIFEEALRTHPH